MRKSKFFSIFVAVIMAFGIVACDNNVEYLNINKEVPPSIEVNDACEFRNAIRAVITDLRNQENLTLCDVEKAVYQKLNTPEVEKAFYQRFGTLQFESNAGISVRSGGISDGASRVLDEFEALEATDFPTHIEYTLALENVLVRNRAILTGAEYATLSIALDVNNELIHLILDDKFGFDNSIVVEVYRWREWRDGLNEFWTEWGECISVTVGLGIGGAIAGGKRFGKWGAVGGFVAGALVGYGNKCHAQLFPPN